jgi:hypothetical protein
MEADRLRGRQVTRYEPGDFYALHVDDDPVEEGTDDDDPAWATTRPALGRLATVLVYLNDRGAGQRGGETVGPSCRGAWTRVTLDHS